MNSQQPKLEMFEKWLNNKGIRLFTTQLNAHFWQCAPLKLPLFRVHGGNSTWPERGTARAWGPGSDVRQAETGDTCEGDAWMTGNTKQQLNEAGWPWLLLWTDVCPAPTEEAKALLQRPQSVALSSGSMAEEAAGRKGRHIPVYTLHCPDLGITLHTDQWHWWRKGTPFYGISVLLIPFAVPPGASPCWSCSHAAETVYPHTTELPGFRAREAHGGFCQIFFSPNITMNIFVVFSPGRKCIHRQCVSVSILLCCNACNEHGLINNSSVSFSYHIPSKDSNVLYRTQLNKLNNFIPCKVLWWFKVHCKAQGWLFVKWPLWKIGEWLVAQCMIMQHRNVLENLFPPPPHMTCTDISGTIRPAYLCQLNVHFLPFHIHLHKGLRNTSLVLWDFLLIIEFMHACVCTMNGKGWLGTLSILFVSLGWNILITVAWEHCSSDIMEGCLILM